jgi:hypothetical protein
MRDRSRWLFEPYVNAEFGEVNVYSRFTQFLGSNVASALIRLPIDLILWLLAFYLGHRFGGSFFGR